jgi:hypothetical protein
MLSREARDAHYLDKLHRLIVESPNVTLQQLRLRTKKLTAQERNDYLERLRAAGKIDYSYNDASGGKVMYYFWPTKRAETAPTKSPDNAAAKIQAALKQARRLFAEGMQQIDLALQLMPDVSATAVDGPMIAPDRGLLSNVETAIMPMPEAELRSAV